MSLDIGAIIQDALSQGLLAPLLSLVVLPLLYRLVGVSKRERREREQQSLRLMMDLERGLGDLAAAAETPAEQARYRAMRGEVLGELRERTEKYFSTSAAGGATFQVNRRERYYLLPPPRGIFGYLWSILTILFAALFLMVTAGVIVAAWNDIAAQKNPILVTIVAFILVMGLFLSPVLLLRWFAFVSSRVGRQSQSQRQGGQSQSQSFG